MQNLELRRRGLLQALALAALSPARARAQGKWPERPIRLVLPFSAGGPGDLNVRAMGLAVGRLLGQTLVIDNKPGAGGIIGSDQVAKSAPDGYTWLMAGNGAIANALLRPKMPYADSDLVPVSGTTTAPSTLVTGTATRAHDLKALQAQAKAKGGLNFGTAGPGSTGHFVAEMVRGAFGVPVTVVHYKSGSETVNAVIAGDIDLASESPLAVAPFVTGGKLRALALAGPERSGPLAEVPTTVEQGFPTVLMQHWGGMFAPKGVPDALLDRMAAAVQQAYKIDPELIDQTRRGGGQPLVGTRAEFTRFMQAEKQRLAAIVAASGMKLD